MAGEDMLRDGGAGGSDRRDEQVAKEGCMELARTGLASKRTG